MRLVRDENGESVTRPCGHDDWDKPSTFLGETGTEQFSVVTRVNEEKIGEHKIHDPFVRTVVILRGFKWAWKALFGGLTIQVSVNSSEGASRAIMTLNPHQLQAETEKMLEERRLSQEAHARAEDYGICQIAGEA